MRIAISHGKTKQEAIQIVDRSFDDIFKGLPVTPVQITGQQRTWAGSIMNFSMTARMGILSNPIKGTVEVTDRDVIIDADLGMLEKLLPQAKVKAAIEGKLQKLLPA